MQGTKNNLECFRFIFSLLCLNFQVQIVWTTNAGPHAMAFKKNSPFTPFMERIMNQVIDSGHFNKLIKDYEAKSSKECMEVVKDEGTPLSYQKLFTIFGIIGAGMGIAVVMLIMEIINKKTKSKLDLLQPNQDVDMVETRMTNSTTQTVNF